MNRIKSISLSKPVLKELQEIQAKKRQLKTTVKKGIIRELFFSFIIACLMALFIYSLI